MSRAVVYLVGVLWLVFAPAASLAEPGSRTVVLAPLETLGAESKAAARIEKLVAGALASVPGHDLAPARDVRGVLKKQPRLRACDGKPDCLAELGKALGAVYVVFGEVGGLGDAEVVSLKLVDTAEAKELRATTLTLTGKADDGAAREAAFRLLAPARYVGTLAAKVDVDGASIYVDGRLVGTSPKPGIELAVGTHAVRITHPEYRDFVRFVDIEFQESTEVAANLQEFPIVATDMERNPALGGAAGRQPGAPVPWYRRWYTMAGVGAAAFITTAVVTGVLYHGLDVDRETVIKDPP